jgi:Flp pilus assembly protein TadG
LAVETKRESGQALVELALVLPILLVIALGAIDFGRAFFAYTTIVNAAREGAWCASLASSCPGGAAGAANAEIGTSLPGGITTTVAGGGAPGSTVTVTVGYSFVAQTTAILGRRTFPLSASASMVVQ